MDVSLRNPKISIILPLEDHRGIGLQAVRSWVEQTCAPEIYDVIAVVDDRGDGFKQKVQALLRPQDRMLVHNAIEAEQSAFAAEFARAELLFFSEGHCIAKPDTVSKAMQYMSQNSVEGFAIRGEPLCVNRIATAVAAHYARTLKGAQNRTKWNFVVLPGFVIKKQAYFRAKGLQYQYGKFAPWLLAPTLEAAGVKLGYATSVSVLHKNVSSLIVLGRELTDFTNGECLYREQGDPEITSRFLGTSPEWERTHYIDRKTAQKAAKLCLAQLTRPRGFTGSWRGRAHCLLQCVRLPFIALAGDTALRLRQKVQLWWEMSRFQFWIFDAQKRYEALVDYRVAVVASARSRYQRQFLSASPHKPSNAISLAMAAQDRHTIQGFHCAETHDGTSFRWASSVSAIKLPLTPGNFKAEIALLAARAVDIDRELSIYLDDTPVQTLHYDAVASSLKFEVEIDRHQVTDRWLYILCRPLRSKADTRELGLPIASVSFQRES